MLAAAKMQQKCKIIEMSDTIRRNEHTKICTKKSEKIEKILTFLKILMQFFYTLHNESFVLIHAPSLFDPVVLPMESIVFRFL